MEIMPNAGNANTPAAQPEKPATPPPQPKMFSGPQGLTVILVLIFAVVGWILYLNNLQNPKIVEKEVIVEKEAEDTMEPEDRVEEYQEVTKQYLGQNISLPAAATDSQYSLEKSLANRRSARAFAEDAVSLENLGQMLWSAQGVTDDMGHRTAPSGHSIYPINIYAVVRNVTGLEPGLYHYIPESHSLGQLLNSSELLTDDAEQASVKAAPVVLVFGAIYSKAATQYSPWETAVKVTNQESGHISENIYLQAQSLGLGTVVVGGFSPDNVKNMLQLPANETIVYLQPFGVNAPVTE